MALLENGPNIDYGVDIRPFRRVSSDRRLSRLGEKLAQSCETRGRGGRIFCGREHEEPPAAVRLDRVTELDGLCVRQTNDRRRMKAHANHEPFGETLVDRLCGDDRRRVPRFRSRGVAEMPRIVFLELRRVDSLAVRF